MNNSDINTSTHSANAIPNESLLFNPNTIKIKPNQSKNPLLNYIKNVPFEISDGIIPDYIVGASSCALFLSLKYHILHPLYIKHRITELGKSFKLRILLIHVDTDDNVKYIGELNQLCFINDITILLSWSLQEAARYLETFKAYEKKSPTSIQEKTATEFVPKLTSILTKANYINRTDVVTLLETFGSFRSICSTSEQQMILCPGIGEKKVRRLYKALHAPFILNNQQNMIDQIVKQDSSS